MKTFQPATPDQLTALIEATNSSEGRATLAAVRMPFSLIHVTGYDQIQIYGVSQDGEIEERGVGSMRRYETRLFQIADWGWTHLCPVLHLSHWNRNYKLQQSVLISISSPQIQAAHFKLGRQPLTYAQLLTIRTNK